MNSGEWRESVFADDFGVCQSRPLYDAVMYDMIRIDIVLMLKCISINVSSIEFNFPQFLLMRI